MIQLELHLSIFIDGSDFAVRPSGKLTCSESFPVNENRVNELLHLLGSVVFTKIVDREVPDNVVRFALESLVKASAYGSTSPEYQAVEDPETVAKVRELLDSFAEVGPTSTDQIPPAFKDFIDKLMKGDSNA